MGTSRIAHRSITHLFVVLIFLVLSSPGFSQETPLLVILPFEAVAVPKADADTVYASVENSFTATGVYTVITAVQRDQVLGSADAAICKDEDCAVEIGQKLSADQVVIGTVALAEGKYIINARIIATASSRTLAAESISITAAADLGRVSNTLALSLIRRAMPGRLSEAEAQPSGTSSGEADGASEPSTGESAEGVAPTTAGTGERPGEGADVSEGPTEKLTRSDLWPLVNICGGLFFLELGNVMGSTSFELRRKISDTYVDYVETSWNFDDLWQTYNSAYVGYMATTILSYVSWSAAVASIPTYLFVFPDRAFRLSRWGTIVFTTGAALSVAGNVLDLLAGAQRYTNDFLYEDYMSAGTGYDELYDRYRRGYVLYSIERLTSYAFWLFGGAGMITAFFLPGPKEEKISGFWDRTALLAGITMVGLGSVTRTVALNHRQTHIESGGDEDAYDKYVRNSVLSYTLWVVGGVGMVLPFLTDFGRGTAAAEETPMRPEPLGLKQLQLLPLPNGFRLRIAY
ncbi:MAG: hypothetical protein JSV89_09630 [Spirochaetaceae bacterium]|nr:MAG: hypothetical protein JSV89_09630 [Spirochaetaceae bacterium]